MGSCPVSENNLSIFQDSCPVSPLLVQAVTEELECISLMQMKHLSKQQVVVGLDSMRDALHAKAVWSRKLLLKWNFEVFLPVGQRKQQHLFLPEWVCHGIALIRSASTWGVCRGGVYTFSAESRRGINHLWQRWHWVLCQPLPSASQAAGRTQLSVHAVALSTPCTPRIWRMPHPWEACLVLVALHSVKCFCPLSAMSILKALIYHLSW